MGKSSRGEKEFSIIQRLKYENSKLKRENSSLRKQLDRVNFERSADLQEIIEEHLKNEDEQDHARLIKNMAEKWKCFKCAGGYLKVKRFLKAGVMMYLRECDCCENKTRPQQFHENVEGLFFEAEKKN